MKYYSGLEEIIKKEEEKKEENVKVTAPKRSSGTVVIHIHILIVSQSCVDVMFHARLRILDCTDNPIHYGFFLFFFFVLMRN